jgi:hypothetical protein
VLKFQSTMPDFLLDENTFTHTDAAAPLGCAFQRRMERSVDVACAFRPPAVRVIDGKHTAAEPVAA